MLSLVFSWVFLCQILHVCRIVDIKDNFKIKSKSWSVQIIQIIFSVEDVGDYLPLNSAVVYNQDFPEEKKNNIHRALTILASLPTVKFLKRRSHQSFLTQKRRPKTSTMYIKLMKITTTIPVSIDILIFFSGSAITYLERGDMWQKDLLHIFLRGFEGEGVCIPKIQSIADSA